MLGSRLPNQVPEAQALKHRKCPQLSWQVQFQSCPISLSSGQRLAEQCLQADCCCPGTWPVLWEGALSAPKTHPCPHSGPGSGWLVRCTPSPFPGMLDKLLQDTLAALPSTGWPRLLASAFHPTSGLGAKGVERCLWGPTHSSAVVLVGASSCSSP